MMPGQSESERDDAAPVDMLASLFDARGWTYEFVSDDELLGEIQGSWAKYQLRAIWRADDNVLQLLCLPDIRVAEDKRAPLYEVMALINEQLWLGHFDLWSNGGVLVYRHGLMLGDDGLLSLDQAQTAVEAAVDECDRFYPAFQFILWGDKSPVGLFAEGLSAGQRETVDRLMAPLGQPEWLANEAILHGFTALAGSGPGFVYRFLDALGAGGEALGLPAEQAARIALAMVEGAVALAAQAGESPATLARRVASPGGTTEAGLAVLDHEGARAQLVAKTLRAASDRSEEMARS
jgi:hypothetical protein